MVIFPKTLRFLERVVLRVDLANKGLALLILYWHTGASMRHQLSSESKSGVFHESDDDMTPPFRRFCAFFI